MVDRVKGSRSLDVAEPEIGVVCRRLRSLSVVRQLSDVAELLNLSRKAKRATVLETFSILEPQIGYWTSEKSVWFLLVINLYPVKMKSQDEFQV